MREVKCHSPGETVTCTCSSVMFFVAFHSATGQSECGALLTGGSREGHESRTGLLNVWLAVALSSGRGLIMGGCCHN